MRRAGPRTPLRQAACVGGASQGRPGRGSLRFRTNGPVENGTFSTTGLCLEEGRRGGGRTCFARSILPILLESTKKPPLKGEVPAKRAEGLYSYALAGRGGSVSRRDHIQVKRKHARLAWARSKEKERNWNLAALREGARGRGFSQRSRLPRIPPYVRPSLQRSPSPGKFHFPHLVHLTMRGFEGIL